MITESASIIRESNIGYGKALVCFSTHQELDFVGNSELQIKKNGSFLFTYSDKESVFKSSYTKGYLSDLQKIEPHSVQQMIQDVVQYNRKELLKYLL